MSLSLFTTSSCPLSFPVISHHFSFPFSLSSHSHLSLTFLCPATPTLHLPCIFFSFYHSPNSSSLLHFLFPPTSPVSFSPSRSSHTPHLFSLLSLHLSPSFSSFLLLPFHVSPLCFFLHRCPLLFSIPPFPSIHPLLLIPLFSPFSPPFPPYSFPLFFSSPTSPLLHPSFPLPPHVPNFFPLILSPSFSLTCFLPFISSSLLPLSLSFSYLFPLLPPSLPLLSPSLRPNSAVTAAVFLIRGEESE